MVRSSLPSNPPIKTAVSAAKDHPPVIAKPVLPAEKTPEKAVSAMHNERQATPISSSAEKHRKGSGKPRFVAVICFFL